MQKPCKKCKGTGEHRKGQKCATCKGSGQVLVVIDNDGNASIAPAPAVRS